MEGAVVVVVRSLLGDGKVWFVGVYLGKKATMNTARKISVFLRFVSKGINVRTRGTNTDLN